jgi:hypothetical protein
MTKLLTVEQIDRIAEGCSRGGLYAMMQVCHQCMEAMQLLAEIADSDMAMREEDEGNVSPLLEKVRAAVGMPTKG